MEKIIKDKYKITSEFGMRIHPITQEKKFHNGVDLAAKEGTPIFAPLPGVVDAIWYSETGGWSLRINHDNDLQTGYAHLREKPYMRVGEFVKQGQKIAEVGNTGKSTGAHLHFTVKHKGIFQDPKKYINL